MPKRDIVRDGRIQASKKRTDRSYLRTPGGAAAPVAPPDPETGVEDEEAQLASDTVAAEMTPDVALAPAPVRSAPPVRSTGAARAIQQQGVRKRRELDVDALAERDARYAMHELRRITMFALLVLVALVVFAIVLR